MIKEGTRNEDKAPASFDPLFGDDDGEEKEGKAEDFALFGDLSPREKHEKHVKV